MKARKTYGINGLLEWHGYVECSGVRMKVDFTNGSVTAFGVAPATFTTENSLTQHIIENSEQFRKGRIKCVMSVALPDDEPKQEVRGKKQEVSANEPEVTEEEPAAEVNSVNSVNAVNEVNSGGDVDAGALKQVEVACADDAKAYLMEHYGATARQLRYLKNIKDVAKANGIEFVGI